MRDQRRLVAIGLAAIVGLPSACGAATHVSAPPRSPSTATSGTASPSATHPAKVPNPFTIVARYSATSLGLKQPIDLAIGPDGNLYLTDTRPSVTVISPDGKVLRRWGKAGSRPGDFSFVVDLSTNVHGSIAIGPDGKVYVSDSGNQRVDVFSPAGVFVRQFGSSGTNEGQFLAVFDLAVDGSGNVFVADDQQQTLSKYSSTGRFEWAVGGTATTDPDLAGPFHLANVDSHGRVVAASSLANRIVYVDPHGRKVDAFTTAGFFPADIGPCNVTVNNVGLTVVESCPGGSVTQNYFATLLFDRAHHLLGAWYGSPFVTDVTPRFGPHGQVFALGQDGSILKVKVALPGA